MKKIYFATQNSEKLREAKEILGLDVAGTAVEIEEIQSIDPLKVAERKALDYYNILKFPIFVEDIALTFSALNKLPGTYINDFSKVLGNEGLIELIKGRKDRSATATATICFVDGKGKTHFFMGEVGGSIAKSPRGTNGFGWDPIFIPEGETKTFAEMNMIEKNKYSMRAKALKKFKKWIMENY